MVLKLRPENVILFTQSARLKRRGEVQTENRNPREAGNRPLLHQEQGGKRRWVIEKSPGGGNLGCAPKIRGKYPKSVKSFVGKKLAGQQPKPAAREKRS